VLQQDPRTSFESSTMTACVPVLVSLLLSSLSKLSFVKDILDCLLFFGYRKKSRNFTPFLDQRGFTPTLLPQFPFLSHSYHGFHFVGHWLASTASSVGTRLYYYYFCYFTRNTSSFIAHCRRRIVFIGNQLFAMYVHVLYIMYNI
jgi:hypothetical protein